MKTFLFLVSTLALVGCSTPPDEGGVSTATPADKLDRPLPSETVSGPKEPRSAGTLQVGK